MAKASNLTENTVNQRLKIIIKSMNMTVRAFSATLEVPESSTRNYLDKGTKLNSDYLERIAHHFSQINLNWLITGQGEPFLSTDPESPSANLNAKKISRSQVISDNSGLAMQGGRVGADLKATDDTAIRLQAAEEKIALLTSQLADKERTIQILLNNTTKPQ